MTGMNTFVNRQGEEVKSEIEFSTYPASETESQDTLPFSKHVLAPASREQKFFRDQS